MANDERVAAFIKEYYPRRHYRGAYLAENWKPNFYWVKRAVRVLKLHRRYQHWVSFGETCAVPEDRKTYREYTYFTETLDEFCEVLDRLGD